MGRRVGKGNMEKKGERLRPYYATDSLITDPKRRSSKTELGGMLRYGKTRMLRYFLFF